MRTVGVTATLTLTALLSVAPVVAAEPERETTAGTSSPAETPPRSSRLKFRSEGPVCMCAGGLSEAEIRAAERARGGPSAELPSIVQEP